MLVALENHGPLKHLMVATDRRRVENVAWVVAAHLGHYQKRVGKVPMAKTLATLRS